VARKLVESESENSHTLLDTRKATQSGVKTNLRQFDQQTTKVASGLSSLCSECSAYFTRCMKRVRPQKEESGKVEISPAPTHFPHWPQKHRNRREAMSDKHSRTTQAQVQPQLDHNLAVSFAHRWQFPSSSLPATDSNFFFSFDFLPRVNGFS